MLTFAFINLYAAQIDSYHIKPNFLKHEKNNICGRFVVSC
jgi:hypothetical protein